MKKTKPIQVTEKIKAKIFSDSYQNAISIFNRTKAFPKQFRPTLGRKLEENALELLSNIQSAALSPRGNKIPLKKEYLMKASKNIDEIRIFMQLSLDLHALTDNGYHELSELMSTIGKQLGGFLRFENESLK